MRPSRKRPGDDSSKRTFPFVRNTFWTSSMAPVPQTRTTPMAPAALGGQQPEMRSVTRVSRSLHDRFRLTQEVDPGDRLGLGGQGHVFDCVCAPELAGVSLGTFTL